MKININARLRRNKLASIAGESYRDENSEIIKQFIRQNKKVLLGIQNKDGVYTIIGENTTFYLTSSGFEKEIPHEAFLEILRGNALALGKNEKYEYVNINDKDSVWVKNAQTMNALWNTILFLNEASK